jgi:hypothetical protein
MIEFIVIIIFLSILALPGLALFAGGMALIVGAIEKIQGKGKK